MRAAIEETPAAARSDEGPGQGTVALAGLASVRWALSLAHTNVNRAYYGTDARAYQLLAGALLALTPGVVRRVSRIPWVPIVAALALVALVVLSTSSVPLIVATQPVRQHPGRCRSSDER